MTYIPVTLHTIHTLVFVASCSNPGGNLRVAFDAGAFRNFVVPASDPEFIRESARSECERVVKPV
jgi:hypothetical protein